MPVMYLKNQDKSVFINLHEFLITPGAFERIMLCIINVLDEFNPNNSSSKGKGGQLSIVSKFPQTVDEISKCIKQHRFSSQSSRREETGYLSGVTPKQI